MFLQLLQSLLDRKYAQIYFWAKSHQSSLSALKVRDNLEYNLYSNIVAMNKKGIIETLNLIKESSIERDLIEEIIQIFKTEGDKIIYVWNYIRKIDQKARLINFIIGDDILIYQSDSGLTESMGIKRSGEEGKDPEKPPNFEVIADSDDQFLSHLKTLYELSKYPNTIIYNSTVYTAVGLSSALDLKAIYEDSEIGRRIRQFKKYEKILRFIDYLELPLQKLFSENQIGIIIYENNIYLVKWVQYISEQQLMTGETLGESAVALLSDIGIKIGVEIKENLELGKLVVFKNTNYKSEQDKRKEYLLEPLMEIDEGILKRKSIYSKKPLSNKEDPSNKNGNYYDLSTEEGCRIFVNDLLGRIESGIFLLSQKTPIDVKDPEELDIYIKISLQKVKAITSLNQRIYLLCDLYKINKNPENVPEIKKQLERNYLLFLNEQFRNKNSGEIPSLIKYFIELGIFKENIGLLINQLVSLFETYYVPSQTIFTIIDLITNNYTIPESQMKLIEKAQMIALTDKILENVQKGKVDKIIPFVKRILGNNPNIKSGPIMLILLDVLGELFKEKYKERHIRIPLNLYLNFLDDVLNFITMRNWNIAENDRPVIKEKIQTLLDSLAVNEEFIIFIQSELDRFLIILFNHIDATFLTQYDLFKILDTLSSIIPAIVFNNREITSARRFFGFLYNPQYIGKSISAKNKNASGEISFEFAAVKKFIVKFLQSYIHQIHYNKEILTYEPQFFGKVIDLLGSMKNTWINPDKFTKLEILAIKKDMKTLIQDWYLKDQLPTTSFEIHRKLLKNWLEFCGLEKERDRIYDFLWVKQVFVDLINGDLNSAENTYAEYLKVKGTSGAKPLIDQFKKLFARPINSLNEIKIREWILNKIAVDHLLLDISRNEYSYFLKEFTSKMASGLSNFVRDGNIELCTVIFEKFRDYFLLFTKSQIESIIEEFSHIYEMNADEGLRFTNRYEIAKQFYKVIEYNLNNYEHLINKISAPVKPDLPFLKAEILAKILSNIADYTYQFFNKAKEWIITVAQNEFLTYEKAFKPIKDIFKIILVQFTGPEKLSILQDLNELIDTFFDIQTILYENKIKFFRIMIDVLPEKEYPQFYPKLKDYLNLMIQLNELEALYYSLKDSYQSTSDQDFKRKLNKLKKKLEGIIAVNPDIFNAWYYYANILVLLGDGLKAINAYKKALLLKPPTTQIIVRLYHNYITTLLMLQRIDEAIEVIRNLNIGIRQNSIIYELLRHPLIRGKV